MTLVEGICGHCGGELVRVAEDESSCPCGKTQIPAEFREQARKVKPVTYLGGRGIDIGGLSS